MQQGTAKLVETVVQNSHNVFIVAVLKSLTVFTDTVQNWFIDLLDLTFS